MLKYYNKNQLKYTKDKNKHSEFFYDFRCLHRNSNQARRIKQEARKTPMYTDHISTSKKI